MELEAACREAGRLEATKWLSGDAPKPRNLFTFVRKGVVASVPLCISGGAVSADDFCAMTVTEYTDMVWNHIYEGVRGAIETAYWDKVGSMGVVQTLQGMFDELA